MEGGPVKELMWCCWRLVNLKIIRVSRNHERRSWFQRRNKNWQKQLLNVENLWYLCIEQSLSVVPSLKLTVRTLKIDGLEDDHFLLGMRTASFREVCL